MLVYVTAGHYMEVKRLHSCHDYISAILLQGITGNWWNSKCINGFMLYSYYLWWYPPAVRNKVVFKINCDQFIPTTVAGQHVSICIRVFKCLTSHYLLSTQNHRGMVYVTAGHYMEVKKLHSCHDYISAILLQGITGNWWNSKFVDGFMLYSYYLWWYSPAVSCMSHFWFQDGFWFQPLSRHFLWACCTFCTNLLLMCPLVYTWLCRPQAR